MKSLTPYRILTFILVPVAVLFGCMDIVFFLNALVAPPLFLFVFLFGCFVIYTFCSLRFLSRHIDTGKPAKRSLRDWIRANAFVSVFIGTMFLLNAFTVFFSSDITLRQFLGQILETQPTMAANMSPDTFLMFMKGFAWFIFIVSAILLIHIRMTFRLLKQYAHLFAEEI